MAVAEVNALSGYKFDNEEVQKLTGLKDLQRAELDNEDTKLNIYFNPVIFHSPYFYTQNKCTDWRRTRLPVSLQRCSISGSFIFVTITMIFTRL
jgi:hypothetical protein